MTPDWIVTALAIISGLGVGGWILEIVKKRLNRKNDEANLRKSNMDFHNVYADAKYVEYQLTEQLQKMVDEKTERLQDILIKREMEHAEQVDYYIKKLAEEIKQKDSFASELREALEEIRALQKRVKELEDHNGNHKKI